MMSSIDYHKRIENIQAELAARRLDALVGTRLKTVTHVAGAFVPWRSATVVPARGTPAVITLMMDAARVADDSWLDRVLPYGPFPGQSLMDVALCGLPLRAIDNRPPGFPATIPRPSYPCMGLSAAIRRG